MGGGTGGGGNLGTFAAQGSPQGAPHLTYSVFSSQGPCRRHMEASLQELKSSQRMVPRAVHLPNCDRKGFYKRKQVRALWRLGCPSPGRLFPALHPRWNRWRFFFLHQAGGEAAGSLSGHGWCSVALLVALSMVQPELSILKQLGGEKEKESSGLGEQWGWRCWGKSGKAQG